MARSAPAKAALVIGGSGALGRAIVSKFQAADWRCICLDRQHSKVSSCNIILNYDDPVDNSLNKVLEKIPTVDAIFSVAGSWIGGDISQIGILSDTKKMLNANLITSVMAGYIANKKIRNNGLLVMTGSSACLSPTPNSLAYGISKSAVHHLCKSLGENNKKFKVACILPETLDTEANRMAMPSADVSKWTPLNDVASQLLFWANDPSKVHQSALYSVITAQGRTYFQQI